ncbi:homeobox protein SIX2 [Biomphalaria pfeifferi]|uniref:Homeobox protein SIX2 n=1 Tax=Biomphalaria pfeifferi TaxID=112525 RepID=A0AAD8BUM8_BIOPF|nr:homeobox protein SIX2 [Biomphalaria pfeifferi]
MSVENLTELLTTWSLMRKSKFLSEEFLDLSENIVCTMVRSEQFVTCREFISGLTCEEFVLLRGRETFLKALIRLNFNEGFYSDVIMLIKNGTFKEPCELLELWNKSHYRLQAVDTGKQLTVARKFRIRKRFPPPKSICFNDVHLKLTSVQHLYQWFQRQCRHPNLKEMDDLSDSTGLSRRNVQAWIRIFRKLHKNIKKKNQFKLLRKSQIYLYSTNGNPVIIAQADPRTGTGIKENNEESNPFIALNFSSSFSTPEDNVKCSRGHLPLKYYDHDLVKLPSQTKPQNHLETIGDNEKECDVQGLIQEKVTLHYFSADVTNSWQPSRIQFLFDICKQEIFNKRNEKFQQENQLVKSEFNCPFPPNVSLNPVMRTLFGQSSSENFNQK